MHLSHTQSHSNLASQTLVRALILLPIAVLIPLAIYEHSPALLVITAIAALFVLAFRNRVEGIQASRPGLHQGLGSRFGDGGTFPGKEPQQRKADRRQGIVIDGGSLEHHTN